MSHWCRYCMKDVPEDDTGHEIEDDELVACNVYGQVL